MLPLLTPVLKRRRNNVFHIRLSYAGVIRLKRVFAGMAAALLVVILVFSLPVHAISAKSAVLMDCTTGRLLYEKNADQKSLIASTTKIMTAILVCERSNILDRVKIPKEAVGIEGSSLYLREGEILTIHELLYGMMLHSGNDAAVALAIYCGGTVEGFAQMMNDKARSIGMNNSHFENPHGLDAENHYSTAHDLAILSRYAMQNPVFSRIVSTKIVNVGQRQLKNHNKLLWILDGADGIKTGFTKAAGRILVSSACRNGRRLIAVTISAPNDWQDHISLMDHGFQQYTQQTIIKKDDVLGYTEIAGGEAGKVQLIANDEFSYLLGLDEEIRVQLPQPGFVYAPVSAGQEAGFAQLFINECWVGKVPLIYGQTVERNVDQEPGVWQRLFGGKKT